MLEFIVLFFSLPLLFYLPGHLLFSGMIGTKYDIYELSLIERIFLKILGSVLVSGWVGLVLAEVGLFSLFNLFLIIALICVFIYFYPNYNKIPSNIWPDFHTLQLLLSKSSVMMANLASMRFNTEPGHIFNKANAKKLLNVDAAIIIILIISLFFSLPPHEWFVSGRDPGIYVSTGINIAKTGSILIQDDFLLNLDPESRELFYKEWNIRTQQLLIRFPGGFYITDLINGEVTPQFFYLWPTWIGISYSILGLKNFFYIIPFFNLMAIAAVFVTGKTLFNKETGLVASLLLGISFAQVWFSKYPTTEIFTQFLVFGGIYTFILFDRHKSKYFGLISALCFGELLLTRIDMILIILPIFLFFYYRILKSGFRKEYSLFFMLFGILGIQAYLTAVLISWPYLLINSGGIKLLDVLLLLSVLIMTIIYLHTTNYNFKDDVFSTVNNINFLNRGIASIIVVYLLYNFFIRPTSDLSSNELNFIKLSWYLGGTVGVLLIILSIWYIFSRKPKREIYFFLLIGLIYMIFYLQEARMATDHPAWVRRYLPVVIPFFILMVSNFITSLYNSSFLRISKNFNKLAVLILISYLLLFSFHNDELIIGYVEYQGLQEELDYINGLFGDKDIIIFNFDDDGIRFSAPLYFIYSKQSAIVYDETKPHLLEDAVIKWNREGSDVYWINPPAEMFMNFTNTNYTLIDNHTCAFPETERPNDHIPNQINPYTIDFEIYRLSPDISER